MINPRLILCGGATIPTNDPRYDGRRVVTLSTHGLYRNVNIRMEDLAKVFQKQVSPRMKDHWRLPPTFTPPTAHET